MHDKPPPHCIGQEMVAELLERRAAPASSGVYRCATAQEDEEPTLPSMRFDDQAPPLALVPMWRVAIGMLLLGW